MIKYLTMALTWFSSQSQYLQLGLCVPTNIIGHVCRWEAVEVEVKRSSWWHVSQRQHMPVCISPQANNISNDEDCSVQGLYFLNWAKGKKNPNKKSI